MTFCYHISTSLHFLYAGCVHLTASTDSLSAGSDHSDAQQNIFGRLCKTVPGALISNMNYASLILQNDKPANFCLTVSSPTNYKLFGSNTWTQNQNQTQDEGESNV